jgi:hypothetical protein
MIATLVLHIHWGLNIRTGVGASVPKLVRVKFVRITNHLRGSWYPNSDKSYKSSDSLGIRNRGGGLGSQTSLDKICSDNESLKGGLGIRNRGGGFGILASLDRICSDRESLKGVSPGIRTIRKLRPK